MSSGVESVVGEDPELSSVADMAQTNVVDELKDNTAHPRTFRNLLLERRHELQKFFENEKERQDDNPYWQRHPPYDLGAEFVGDKNAWKISWDEFKRRHPGMWYSTDGERLRSIRSDCVSFFGYTVCEDVLQFGVSGLEKIEISVFNKGITGEVTADADAIAILNTIASNIKAASINESSADDGQGKAIARYVWEASSPQVRASLGRCVHGGVWCAEYLNFEISNVGEELCTASLNPRDNVRRVDNDVYIEGIPMVNQGRKGYCVPATISRLLKYYGVTADMHELALIMETECGGGTKIGGDFPTLNRIVAETGLKRTDYRNFEKYDEGFFTRYNVAARDNGGKELRIEDFTVDETDEDGDVVHMKHYDWMCDAMDDELKRKSRYYDRLGYLTFRSGIISSVCNGYPLIWSVDRLFPWDRADGWQGNGHMRLIVGYNDVADQVLYSDSWGNGNEFKRVSMSDAWGVTDFMSCLSPK